MIKGQGGQIVGVQINLNAGGAYGGAVSVFVDGDHSGQIAGAGVVSNRGNGSYDYQATANETNFAHVAFTFVPGATASPQTVEVDTISPSQIAALQATTGLTSIAIPDVLLAAAIEIQVGRAGGSLEPGVSSWMLQKLNRLLDRWNATPEAAYVKQFASYVPTVNHAPHTLGPAVGADWSTNGAGRPTRITRANLILNTVTPNVRVPIRVRNFEWFAALPVQRMASSMVTDLYYEPGWPNGSVNLWPVPTATYPIELLTDGSFSAFGPNDTLYLPFGYPDAVIKTLAEECAPGLGQTPTEALTSGAADARVVAFGATIENRNIKTRDAGMPGGRRGGRYLYRTGRIE